jgi:RimJ/RimL family protein N-acetyltransferase
VIRAYESAGHERAIGLYQRFGFEREGWQWPG